MEGYEKRRGESKMERIKENEGDGGEREGRGWYVGHMTRSRLTINCNDDYGKKKNRMEKGKSSRMSKYTISTIFPISSVFQ
jgi:hypothetical protein